MQRAQVAWLLLLCELHIMTLHYLLLNKTGCSTNQCCVAALCRLLAEVLSTRVRAAGYGQTMDGGYGGDREIQPEAVIPTTQVPPANTSSAATASAGVLSFVAAVMALAMF
jgi:hypothetical protein